MRTVRVKLFKFGELKEEAQEKALENYRRRPYEDIWRSERDASYEAAEKIYEELENIQEEICGARLYAWIENNLSHYWTKQNRISKHGEGKKFRNSDWEYKFYKCVKFRVSKIFSTNNLENCPLTGVCYDFDFLKPIIEFMKSPDMRTCNTDLTIPDYEKVAQADYEWEMSEEYIKDNFEANEYEFTKDGKQY